MIKPEKFILLKERNNKPSINMINLIIWRILYPNYLLPLVTALIDDNDSRLRINIMMIHNRFNKLIL
jgi:hypothetical protein